MKYPKIIQGGMGVAVSGWPLARAVSTQGQLGVVSGTALDIVMIRRLQLGDVGGHMRRAFDHFPVREMAERIWDRYFVPGGKRPDAPFKSKPVPNINQGRAATELAIVGNFCEVFLAKYGHNGMVGINFLEKIQIPTLPSLFGAMLAGVEFVLMGAGIPRAIPAIMDGFVNMEPAELRIDVVGAKADETFMNKFNPTDFIPASLAPLSRPNFFPIVSSYTLALTLARKGSGSVEGFVIEGPTAGGHNAPPRGAISLNEKGEPIYGPRDVPDLAQFRELGIPFWLAGSYGMPGKLAEAQAQGASGVQVGTPFAYCEESGMDPEVKARVLALALEKKVSSRTDPLASPTGFPFKVVDLEGTVSMQDVYEERTRICDLGYLRHGYRQEDGTVGYRCPAEPVEDYVAKGGAIEDTVGRKCVCNGLISAVGMGQYRKDGGLEPAIVTSGDAVANLATFMPENGTSYTAADVIAKLLA